MASPQNVRNFRGILAGDAFQYKAHRQFGIKVLNNSGSAIPAYSVVYISGYDVTTNLLTIAPANAASANQVDLYVNARAIASTHKGVVYEGYQSTDTLNTSAGTAGNPVYLSATTAGALSFTAPAGSAIKVGYVRTVSSTVGSIVFDFPPSNYGGGIQSVSGVISSANITGTAAGQLGHANGVIMVPAGGTHVINRLVGASVNYNFATAAYTGGGAITVNIGGGGAALTGTISYANSVGKGSNAYIDFVPLAAAANVYTENNPLNLVAASSPTQPGTAAGTVTYTVWYSPVSLSF
jgi:hypothetical protein